MKKIFISTFLVAGFLSLVAVPTGVVRAQGMMGAGTSIIDDGHTAQEEAEGKAIWEKIQNKEMSCADLSDENYETLGEYFMGLMAGNAHAAMNAMMTRMMGEEGEAQMHVLMGKRLSGCVPDADAPLAFGSGFGMMGGTGMMSMMAGLPWGGGLRSGGTGMMSWLGTPLWAGVGLWLWLWALVWFVNSVLLGVLLWALIKKFWKK